MAEAAPETDFNTADFSKASALVVSSSDMTRKFLIESIRGFGFGNIEGSIEFDQAKGVLERGSIDLVLADASVEASDAFKFMAWLRRSKIDDNYYKPALLMASNITNSMLDQAREAGYHFIMTKPVAPDALMKRIKWLAQHDREFIETDTYTGPDRRFRFEGPPPGMAGRRASDLSATLGDASDPNMDQDSIDALLKPQKIEL